MTTKTYSCTRDQLIAACAILYPNGGSFEVSGDAPTIIKRHESFTLPTDEAVAAAVDQALLQAHAAGVKAKANEIITGRYPLWKQLNMQARFSELMDKGTLSDVEASEKNALLEVWAWVKAVRAESDRLEADPGATPNWPA